MALMAASRQLRPPPQAATVETIVSLLALSGLQEKKQRQAKRHKGLAITAIGVNKSSE